jgi:hypothetical protein
MHAYMTFLKHVGQDEEQIEDPACPMNVTVTQGISPKHYFAFGFVLRKSRSDFDNLIVDSLFFRD